MYIRTSNENVYTRIQMKKIFLFKPLGRFILEHDLIVTDYRT